MRNTFSSGNTECTISFSSRADLRSRPNGFSMITRAFFAHPDVPRFSITVPKSTGGIAR